jgi:hypothetical protein
MKKYLLVAACLVSLSMKAQTLEETEKWISSELDNHHDTETRYSFNNHHSIISEWSLTHKLRFYDIAKGEKAANGVRIVDLAKIKEITYFKKDEKFHIILSCKELCGLFVETSKDYVKEEKITVRNSTPQKGTKKETLVNEIWVTIAEVSEESLLPRIEKAFLHLIKLNGGDAKIVPYKPKEPF